MANVTPTATAEKAAKKDTIKISANTFSGLGVDIGTANIAASRFAVGNNNMDISSIRDCFISLPEEEEGNLSLSGLPYFPSADGERLLVIGDEAIELAAIHGTELRRPLAKGFISDREDLSKEVVTLILGRLMGKPQTPNELAVYSVPGPPSDDAAKAQYHTRFFSDRLKELGFTPLPINEAMAVIYSETCQPEKLPEGHRPLTGLGLSFGAGMVNVALVHKGMLVRAFSMPFGGDFIDEAAAKATNSPLAQVTLLKESGVDLLKGTVTQERPWHDAQTHRQAEAISLMYRELLTKLRDGINEFFSRPENRVGDMQTVMPVIVSGGTSRADGFMALFDDIVLNGLETRFPVAPHATGAASPMHSVAQGALVFARMRSAKRE